jgi:hypothetical protein
VSLLGSTPGLTDREMATLILGPGRASSRGRSVRMRDGLEGQYSNVKELAAAPHP